MDIIYKLQNFVNWISSIFAAESSKSKLIKLKFGRMNAILVRKRTVLFNGKNHFIDKNFHFAWVNKKSDFFIFPRLESNPHIIISGMSGFGKSTLFKSLLIQITQAKIPCIIFDAHGEHADSVRELDGNVHNAIYSGINLLELDGATVSERISELTRLLKEVYSLGYIQATKLSDCLWYTYRKAGARSRLDKSIARVPTIKDLLDEVNIFIRNAKSQGERNTLLHLKDRLSLLNNSAFSGSFIKMDSIANELHSFSLANMKSKEAQIIYIGELLSRLYSTMHDSKREHTLRMYIMIDEAQFLTDNSNSNTIISKLIEEGRKYGVGVIIVTHAASTLNKKIIGNSATFLSFYAREPSEISYISKVISGNESNRYYAVSEKIGALRQNEAVLVSSIARNPIFISTPSFSEINTKDNPIKEKEAKELLKSIAKRLMRLDELKIKSKIPQNVIKSLIESKFLDYMKENNEEWVMYHNNSLSIEHEFHISKISKLLNENRIENRIIDNSTGPDIIAVVDNKRIAIEYETGSKSLESTRRMINSRINNYYKIIIITKEVLVEHYNNICNNNKVVVISSIQYEILPKSLVSL